MDIFEKQQAIEAIKTVVKARWFYVSAIIVQGIILKYFFPSVPIPSGLQISVVTAIVMALNLMFWLYLRRPPEKINNSLLKIIRFSQVPIEQLGLAAIFYYSGTANKVLMMMYMIPIMEATLLYRTKGVVLATFSTIIIYSGLVLSEFAGFMPYLPPEAAAQSAGKLLRGDWALARVHLIVFNLYIIGAAFYAGYLADLFRRREQRVINQKNELGQKTDLLIRQTREITETKDWLHDELNKSDRARMEEAKLKEKLEAANRDLKAKVDELQKFNEVTVGREIKMVELKKEIEELKNKLKQQEV